MFIRDARQGVYVIEWTSGQTSLIVSKRPYRRMGRSHVTVKRQDGYEHIYPVKDLRLAYKQDGYGD